MLGLEHQLVRVPAGHLSGVAHADVRGRAGGRQDVLGQLLGRAAAHPVGRLLVVLALLVLALRRALGVLLVPDLVGLAVVPPDVGAVVDEAVLVLAVHERELLAVRAVGRDAHGVRAVRQLRDLVLGVGRAARDAPAAEQAARQGRQAQVGADLRAAGQLLHVRGGDLLDELLCRHLRQVRAAGVREGRDHRHGRGGHTRHRDRYGVPGGLAGLCVRCHVCPTSLSPVLVCLHLTKGVGVGASLPGANSAYAPGMTQRRSGTPHP